MEAVAQLVALVCQVASRSACWPALRLVSWENSLMGYNFAGGGDGDQVFLMPPDPRDWLPEGHLAWAMRRAAAGLDLAPVLAAYRADGQGNTAYHPRMMVALVMYCYAKGIRSSRAIEMATFDDVGARVICGGLHPDHATNARFAGRHKEPLKGLLVQSLVACAREGLVRVDITAGDGTKVKASASMAANATAEQLGLEIAELEKLLEAEVAGYEQRAAARAAGSATWPRGRRPGPAEQQRDVRASAAAAARAAGKLEEAIAAPAAAAPPARPAKANVTDLASRVMPLTKGGFDQLYNLQALAVRRQVICAIGTHDSTGDTAAMHPLLAAAAANLAAAGIADRIGKALFDAGYASEDNFTAGCGAELYVAVTRESVQAGQQPGGTVPLCGQPGWQAMAAKLDTPEGRAVCKQRKAIIEPVFAQLFARFGRTLHHRGDMVTTELHLWAAVHNMLKAIRARARRQRQAAARPALA